jgi:hypothetical protein
MKARPAISRTPRDVTRAAAMIRAWKLVVAGLRNLNSGGFMTFPIQSAS